MEIFPTAYFGPIAYYQEFIHSKKPLIEVKEHFVKQSLRTRCEILGPNGKQLLSVPVRRMNGNKTVVEDLEIVEDGWRKIHWKAIETAYSSAAYFDYYGIEIKELIFSEYTILIDLNTAIHKRVLKWLDFDIPTTFTDEYRMDTPIDFRTIKLDSESSYQHKSYHQVFLSKDECVQNLSILDLILSEGPMAHNWMIN